MNILVISAHPDDEVLGCGGTIARLAQETHDVYVAILGEGITSRFPERSQADSAQIEALRNASSRAAAVLGVREVFLHNLPDNRFDTVPLLEIVKIIEGLIDKLKPSVIYTHHGGDLNMDHVIVSRATLIAARPMAGCPVRELYAYEVPSSSEWAFHQLAVPFRPTLFVDISSTLDLKVRAMNLYESEMRAFPHPRSPEALQAIAHRWGSVAGLLAAEAFEPVRVIQ